MLVKTSPFDDEMRQLADRHYSRNPRAIGKPQFTRNGEKLILRNAEGTILFAWTHDLVPRWDDQTGVNNAIFRNESDRRSSDIILEAEQHALRRWGPSRLFTYIDPAKVASPNPGYCFKVAGWRFVGMTRAGLHLLVKDAQS